MYNTAKIVHYTRTCIINICCAICASIERLHKYMLTTNSFIFQREGLSKFNKIYQFSYAFQGQNCNMIMTSVSGHLLGHDFPATYRGWQSCNPVELFSAPVIKSCTKDMENIKVNKQLESTLTY
jgi:DNA topoisomerase IA